MAEQPLDLPLGNHVVQEPFEDCWIVKADDLYDLVKFRLDVQSLRTSEPSSRSATSLAVYVKGTGVERLLLDHYVGAEEDQRQHGGSYSGPEKSWGARSGSDPRGGISKSIPDSVRNNRWARSPNRSLDGASSRATAARRISRASSSSEHR